MCVFFVSLAFTSVNLQPSGQAVGPLDLQPSTIINHQYTPEI